MDISKPEFRKDYKGWKKSNTKKFIEFPHGGLEIKNTFGIKISKASLLPGQQRVSKIKAKLEWKAHHRYTNYLLATFSDYIDGCPQIVAAMFSSQLTRGDWKKKQDPKPGSTMTSFSVTESSGWKKLSGGIRLCLDREEYRTFFGVTEA